MESIFCSNNIFYLIPRYFLNFWPNICIYIEINWNYLFRTPQERSLVCLLYQHAGSIYIQVLYVIFRMNGLCHSACIRKPNEYLWVCSVFYRLSGICSYRVYGCHWNEFAGFISFQIVLCFSFRSSYLRRVTHIKNFKCNVNTDYKQHRRKWRLCNDLHMLGAVSN